MNLNLTQSKEQKMSLIK